MINFQKEKKEVIYYLASSCTFALMMIIMLTLTTCMKIVCTATEDLYLRTMFALNSYSTPIFHHETGWTEENLALQKVWDHECQIEVYSHGYLMILAGYFFLLISVFRL